jgi:mRNA interferase MazF
MKRGLTFIRLIVLLPFPFSDLSKAKLRPAVVLAQAGRDDWILCQVTSNPYADEYAVSLTDEGFRTGSLQRLSYARPGKLFTAHRQLMVASAGKLKHEAFKDIVGAVLGILSGALSEHQAAG